MKRLLLTFVLAVTAHGDEFTVEMANLAKLDAWLSTLKSRQDLLDLRAQATKPNYSGNAYAEIQKTLWLRVAKGETLTELLYAR